MFQVQKQQCATCIYRSDNPLDLKELEATIADGYGGFDTFRSCHHTDGNKICCAGFWTRHKDKFQLGQLAQRLDFVEFVNIDNQEKVVREIRIKLELVVETDLNVSEVRHELGKLRGNHPITASIGMLVGDSDTPPQLESYTASYNTRGGVKDGQPK